MEVSVDLDIHEVDGEDLPVGKGKILGVKSHRTWNGIMGYVVLKTPDGKAYTVSGQELEKAVSRCLDT